LRRIFIFFFYRALLIAAFPFILIYLLIRVIRDPRYLKGLGERFGFLTPLFDRTIPGGIWLHAVSVGEVVSSLELVRRLRAAYPQSRIFVSCGTLAGKEVAREKFAQLADGVFFAPLDYCFAVRRVLRIIRPNMMIVLETEIWPNLYREAKRAGCGLVIVNGRISPKAFPSYKRWRWFFAEVLAVPDRILVQSDEDRQHYLDLGAPPASVFVAGNLKYDFNPQSGVISPVIEEFLRRPSPPRIWIAASTTAATNDSIDEDDAVIAAFDQLADAHQDLMLIVAPRKPERFDAVAQKFAEVGLAVARRSELPSNLPARVLLLDSIGELGALFAIAEVVLMGGTLTQRGGHNILEPAIFGKPVIIGPHMENFPEIAARFRAGNAVLGIEEPDEIATAVDRLLRDSRFAEDLGRRAKELAEAQRGATDRALAVIAEVRSAVFPKSLPYGPLRPVLRMLSQLWKIGGNWKRARSLAHQQRLAKPVISIGGVAMGGTGKTPMVRWLAGQLHSHQQMPAILTRGYRRQSREGCTVLSVGEKAPVSITGDEAQQHLRDGVAHLGISADRAAAARLLERKFNPDVFLLDDGFQHARLHRDLDIVLLDAMDPFAGGALFPLGRLREPLDSLKRASAFVITRCIPGDNYKGLRSKLAEINPDAPVFLSRVVPECWVDAATGDRRPLEALRDEPAAAFCGLGNPASFWSTLAALGYRPVLKRAFSDHHRYTGADLLDLSSRSRVLLTTEKDAMNLPDGAFPACIFWLRIGIEMDDAERFNNLVQAAIKRPSTKPY
jgi:3-deoxy-D-manno-octulosonic-acid transferase